MQCRQSGRAGKNRAAEEPIRPIAYTGTMAEPRQEATPYIYLNNAATTWPKPEPVIAEVEKCIRSPVFEHGRSTLGGATDYPEETRTALAGFFHAEKPDHFVFTSNATDALNILIHGFVKNAG